MESFLVAVNAVIPFFCYLALGYTMKIRGVVSEEFLQKLNQMVFRVFYKIILISRFVCSYLRYFTPAASNILLDAMTPGVFLYLSSS